MKKNDSITGLFIFLFGVVVGICPPLLFCSKDGESSNEMTHSDTTYVYKMVPYSKIDLEANRQRLEVPNINVPRMVMVPEDSVTVVYKDSIKYVALPRQFYYTSTDDVEIWYSGVDPQIDSVNVFSRSSVITHTIKNVPKNRVGVGVEASYYGSLCCPIYFEYEHDFKPWLSCYLRLGHDMISRSHGAVAGMKMKIGF